MSTPTTRKFPRTMAEAFPSDARHAYAIEHSRRFNAVGSVLLAIAIGLGLGLALVAWWGA